MTAASRSRFESVLSGLAGLLLGCLGVLVVFMLFCATPAHPRASPLNVSPPPAAAPAGEFTPAATEPAPQNRIVELPEDGGVWHLSLFVHADWQSRKADREVVAAFEADPQLRSLKAQAKYHLYTEADPMYRQRFAQHVPVLPAVMLQRGNGEVVFKSSAGNLDPPALGGQVATQIYQYRCDNGYCYPVQPKPTPSPTPVFDPPLRGLVPRLVEPVPDVLPIGGLSGVLQFLEFIKDGRTWAVIAVIVGLVVWQRLRQPAPPARTRVVYRSRKRK